MTRIDYIEQLNEDDRALLDEAMDVLTDVISFSGNRRGNDRFWEVENALAKYLLENQPAPALSK